MDNMSPEEAKKELEKEKESLDYVEKMYIKKGILFFPDRAIRLDSIVMIYDTWRYTEKTEISIKGSTLTIPARSHHVVEKLATLL